MSKNLEEAYKEYTQGQIPDLWDRIEAELPEKKIVKKENKREKLLRNRVWTTAAAAACLCLLFAGSGIFRLIENKSADQMSAIDKNTGMAVDKGMTDSAMDAALAESVEMEDAATDGVEMEDATADMDVGADTQEITREESVGVAGSESESKSYDVVITISDIENTGEEILYYGVIVSAIERPAEVDGKVTFCISDDAFGTFEIGKTYSLRLTEKEMQGTEIQPYLVTEVYGEQ